MKLDMFDVDKFVELNHCKQVTSPVLFGANKMPNPDGLLSYEIFGYSEDERKNRFGYIDLKDHYIHPIVYAMLSARMGSIKYILSGAKKCIISDGKITIVPDDTPGAGNGLQFIYDNFDKINWINELEENEIASIDRKTRLKFLKTLKKEEFFITKWLVLPAHYREEAADATSMGDVINQLYKNLIGATHSMRGGFTFDIFGNTTKMRIQELLLQIYQTTMTPVSGKSVDIKTGEVKGVSKNSILLRNVLGKTIDHGANTVIVAPLISDAATIHDIPVPFGSSLLPLPTCIALFNPFFIHEVTLLIDAASESLNTEVKTNMDSSYYIDRSQYNATVIEKIVSRFIKSDYERFDTLEFTIRSSEDSSFQANMEYTITEYKTREDAEAERNGFERSLTYTDIMYMAAVTILKNKHVLITRHPITNNKNIYPARVVPFSTARTRKVYLHNLNREVFKSEVIEYEHYPYIENENEPKKPDNYYEFVGTSVIGNAVLSSLGGDYDGDTVFIRGLFSLQANAEAEEIINAKSNILGASGEPIRGLSKISKDLAMSLFELTKD